MGQQTTIFDALASSDGHGAEVASPPLPVSVAVPIVGGSAEDSARHPPRVATVGTPPGPLSGASADDDREAAEPPYSRAHTRAVQAARRARYEEREALHDTEDSRRAKREETGWRGAILRELHASEVHWVESCCWLVEWWTA